MKNKIFITYRILITISFMGIFCYCSKSQSDEVNEMKCPVIIKAKLPATEKNYASLVLQGGDGTLKEFKGYEFFAAAIINSMNVGDTVKNCH